ncbi:hypothetical protein ACWDXT_20245 [Streptomyces sp. NPDC003236]
MTTALRRFGARGAALRWTPAAVIALIAALAVLVHHETAAALTHVPPARSMSGMDHTAPPAVAFHGGGHATASGMPAPAPTRDDHGVCSSTATQHCAVAGVDSLKLVPPHKPAPGGAPAFRPGASVGRDVPGTTGRAPPDLSALSRLLL